MSQTPNTAIAVIGIDIGKNSFHVVGHDVLRAAPSHCGKNGRVAKWKRGSPTYRHRHGSLRRRPSPEPQTRIAWS